MKRSEKILFHYTSLEGFLGIIKSKSIWATNILYLNDASELNYSLELLKEQISEFKNNISIDKNSVGKVIFFDKVIDRFNNIITNTKVLGFFVCSFSEEKDLLSQWRGYCSKGIGFSLGFKLSKLKKCAKEINCLIKKCNYNKDKQIISIKKLIEMLSFQYDKAVIKSTAVDKDGKDSINLKLAAAFLIKFIELAPTFKNPKFKEEKEWRIISSSLHSKRIEDLIDFRPGQSMIIPYIEIPISKDSEDLVINQIVVGPTREPELSKASVEMVLNYKKFILEDKVINSEIPYRSW